MHLKPRPWYERDGGRRLAHDQKRVAEMCPDLVYHIDKQRGRVFAKGKITLLSTCGIPTHIPIRLDFPDNYPQQEPLVYDIEHRFLHRAERHFCANGQCCLWLPPESRWNAKDPEGLCRFLEEVAVFFDRQLVYDAEGKGIWPGGERDHNDAGYTEFILDMLDGDRQMLSLLAPILANKTKVGRNHQCPCRSGRKYKKCHQDTIDAIRRKVGSAKVTLLLRSWFDKEYLTSE